MYTSKLFFLILFFSLSSILIYSQGVPEEDSLALVEFYNTANGSNWTQAFGGNKGDRVLWYNEEDKLVKDWFRVFVDNDRVSKLQIDEWIAGIEGPLTHKLSELTAPVEIDIRRNKLRGLIPSSFASLTSLQELSFAFTELESPLPDLSSLRNLESLTLGFSKFSEPIPTWIWELNKLRTIQLDGNEFKGSLPSNIDNLRNLEILSVGLNKLDGDLPDRLWNLIKLEGLYLYNNQFTGSISPKIGMFTELNTIWLFNNDFIGPIPTAIGDLQKLKHLEIGNNNFDGAFPQLGPSIKTVSIDTNSFISLPDFSNTKLSRLNVEENKLIFRHLEPVTDLGLSVFTYAPQACVDIHQKDETEGKLLFISVGGEFTNYKWYINDVEVKDGPDSTILITDFDENNNYSCEATNTLLPELTICTNPLGPGDKQIIVNSIGDGGLDEDAPTGNCTTGRMIKINGVDVPECTLRAAIELVNRDKEKLDDTRIKFGIESEGVPTIKPGNGYPLPKIIYPLELDGSTQEGGFVIIDGSQTGEVIAGFHVSSSLCKFKYLNIVNFMGHGLFLEKGSLHLVQNCVVKNNKIHGIVLSGSVNNTIDNNVINDNGSNGIHSNNANIKEGIEIPFTENVIKNNIIGLSSALNVRIPNGGNGIEIQFGRRDRIINNTSAANKKNGILLKYCKLQTVKTNSIGKAKTGDIFGNEYHGFYLIHCNIINVTDNTISHNLKNGMEITLSKKIIVTDNIIRGNSNIGVNSFQSELSLIDELKKGEKQDISVNLNEGIRINGGKAFIVNNNIIKNDVGLFVKNINSELNLLVIGNNFYDNTSSAWDIGDSKAIMNDNHVLRNGGNTGIHLTNSFSRIKGNSFENDASDGIFLDNQSDALINENNFKNNQRFAVNNDNGNHDVEAQNNWWGNESGPSGNGPGSGDAVSENVDYSNWLTEPVGLIGTAVSDTIYVPKGDTVNVEIFVRNWTDPEDIVGVDVYDDQNWKVFTGDVIFGETLKDSVATNYNFDFAIPENPSSPESRVTAEVNSFLNNEKDTVNFLLICEERRLDEIVLVPDTVYLDPGDTMQFSIFSFDQFDDDFVEDLTWLSQGGVVDDNGQYIASNIGGIYEISASNSTNTISGTSFVIIDSMNTTAIKEVNKNSPIALLSQNYPNPFSGSSIIEFEIKKSSIVNLSILDLTGNLIATLNSGYYREGIYQVEWDGNNNSGHHTMPGLYFYRLIVDGQTLVKKMIRY